MVVEVKMFADEKVHLFWKHAGLRTVCTTLELQVTVGRNRAVRLIDEVLHVPGIAAYSLRPRLPFILSVLIHTRTCNHGRCV